MDADIQKFFSHDDGCWSKRVPKKKLILVPNFEGIPENLVFGCVLCVILLIVFLLLARFNRNYAQISLWMQAREEHRDVDNDATKILYEEIDINLDEDQAKRKIILFFFFETIYFLRKKHILKKCGNNAYNYVLFQQFLLLSATIQAFVGMVVLLPLHLSLNSMPANLTYARTTILNMKDEKDLVWIHVLLSVSLFPLSVVLMKMFRLNMEPEEFFRGSDTYLLFIGIPSGVNLKRYIEETIKALNSSIHIRHIDRQYNSSWNELALDLTRAEAAKKWCEENQLSLGKPIRIKPNMGARFCTFSCCTTYDALEFYTKEVEKYSLQIEEERNTAKHLKQGIAIVQFAHLMETHFVYKHYNRVSLLQKLAACFLSRILVYKVPILEDIISENLSSRIFCYYLRAVVFNVILIFVFVYLTTPIVIWTAIEYPLKQLMQLISPLRSVLPIVIDSLPGLVFTAVSESMPICIVQIETYQYYWKKSSRNFAIMIKVYVYLIFMLLILPMLGITNFNSLIEPIFTSKKFALHVDCLTRTNLGALYINHLINLTFMTAPMLLIRMGNLVMYTLAVVLSRSKAEMFFVTKTSINNFEMGFFYSYRLVAYTLMVTFCFLSPLITAIGFLFHVVIHFVDRYNIYFSYARFVGEHKMHLMAMNFFMMSSILNQVLLLFFLTSNHTNYLAKVTVGFTIFCSVFAFLQISNIFGKFPSMKPRKLPKKSHEGDVEEDESSSEEEEA